MKDKWLLITIGTFDLSAEVDLSVLPCQADLAATSPMEAPKYQQPPAQVSTVALTSVSPVAPAPVSSVASAPRLTAAPNPVSTLAPSSQWTATWICLNTFSCFGCNSNYRYFTMKSQSKTHLLVRVNILSNSSGMEDWMAEQVCDVGGCNPNSDWEMVQRMANRWQPHPQIAQPVEALKVDLQVRGRDAYASNGYKLP